MSSKRICGVLFNVYPGDHLPMHAHATFAGIEIIIELDPAGVIRLAARRDAIRPRNAKASDVRRVLRIARDHGGKLIDLWKGMNP